MATSKTPAVLPREARARVMIKHVNPWTVLKTSFILSFFIGVVTIAATAVLWIIFEKSSLFATLNDVLSSFAGGDNKAMNIKDYVDFNKAVAASALLACVNCLVIPAVATLTAFFYNLMTKLIGGVEVSLSQDV